MAEDEENSLRIEPDQLEFVEMIGEGTTAAVFVARMGSGLVAVKEIHAWRDYVDHETVTCVERELSILSQADHPHIIRLIGLVPESEPLRLVFEYCSGGSLFELLHNRWDIVLTWPMRLKILLDGAQAMGYLHSFLPPIMHRDLKSLNMLLLDPVTDQDSLVHVKLGDFGFARTQEGEMTQGVGTKHWMAPEVSRSTAYTTAADVFSYAMVIYEVICRHVPFETLQPATVAKKLGDGERPHITDHVDPTEVPDGLCDLIARCWAQDAGERPPFAEIVNLFTEMSG